MERIRNFIKKGGVIVWSELDGTRATWVGEPKDFLIEETDNGLNVYRCNEDEYKKPQKGFLKAKGFLG